MLGETTHTCTHTLDCGQRERERERERGAVNTPLNPGPQIPVLPSAACPSKKKKRERKDNKKSA